jgi:uncharacterized protein YmfQ (DUF2313 family)
MPAREPNSQPACASSPVTEGPQSCSGRQPDDAVAVDAVAAEDLERLRAREADADALEDLERRRLKALDGRRVVGRRAQQRVKLMMSGVRVTGSVSSQLAPDRPRSARPCCNTMSM